MGKWRENAVQGELGLGADLQNMQRMVELTVAGIWSWGAGPGSVTRFSMKLRKPGSCFSGIYIRSPTRFPR